MAPTKRLGVFVKIPEPGKVKTRLVPPLSEVGACELYRAFLEDLFVRLKKLKGIHGTVFFSGRNPEAINNIIPRSYDVVPQTGESLGERLAAAFDTLLDGGCSSAVIIGSDSPDLPIQYIKRAFLKLKHKDAVLGPATDGGYYLIGLKNPAPELFVGVRWGERSVFGDTLERVEACELTLALLPLWYDVDTRESVALLADMVRARRLERSGRCPAIESALKNILESER